MPLSIPLFWSSYLYFAIWLLLIPTPLVLAFNSLSPWDLRNFFDNFFHNRVFVIFWSACLIFELFVQTLRSGSPAIKTFWVHYNRVGTKMSGPIFRRPLYRQFIAGRFSLIGIIELLFFFAKIILPLVLCFATHSLFLTFPGWNGIISSFLMYFL